MNMLCVILPVVVSAVITALVVPFIIRFSFKKRLFDSVNERTVHSGVVPRLGGGAFILAVLVAVGVCAFMPCNEDGIMTIADSGNVWRYVALLGAAMIIYLAGLWDDIRNLNYKFKFLSQLIAAVLIVVGGDFWINNLHGLLFVDYLPAAVGMPLSVLLIMFIINAFNLIDGIDGLASALGCVASLAMGLLLVSCGQLLMGVMSLALAASLAVFFCFNKLGTTEKKTKVFMGDGGSQTMGLLLAFLVVYVSGYTDLPLIKCEGSEGSISLGMPGQSPVPFALALSLTIVPCFDALRVMFNRIFKGRNPFLADQTHIHHKFLRMGYSATVALGAVFGIAIVVASVNMALLLSNIGLVASLKLNLILLLDIVLWCVLHAFLNKRLQKAECTK